MVAFCKVTLPLMSVAGELARPAESVPAVANNVGPELE